MSVFSLRAMIGRMLSLAAASIKGWFGYEKRYSTPSSWRIFATASTPFMRHVPSASRPAGWLIRREPGCHAGEPGTGSPGASLATLRVVAPRRPIGRSGHRSVSPERRVSGSSLAWRCKRHDTLDRLRSLADGHGGTVGPGGHIAAQAGSEAGHSGSRVCVYAVRPYEGA